MMFPKIIVISILLTACSSTKLPIQSGIPIKNSEQRKEYKSTDLIFEEAPFPIRKARVEYPKLAKSNGISGIVILQAEVFTDGTVGRVEVIQSVMSGKCVLGEAAVKSVKKWKFSPAKSKGKPVNCWVTIPITFNLD